MIKLHEQATTFDFVDLFYFRDSYFRKVELVNGFSPCIFEF